MKNILLTILLMALWCVPAVSQAQEAEVVRPVTSAYTLEMGGARIIDTYLTPLRYDGFTTAFGYERSQAMKFDPERWVMQLNVAAGFDRTRNPARNATIWATGLTFRWGMTRRFRPLPSLTVAAGGSTSANLGVLYLSRNQNNPAAAKASWTVNAASSVAWTTSVARIPVTLRYQPTLPVAGVFFSPEYDELYYEIYLGNRRNLAHAAWWGNYFSMDNMLTADVKFGATWLRLGYHNTILSTKVSNITSRMVSHSFVVGLSGEWMSLRKSSLPSAGAKIISAY